MKNRKGTILAMTVVPFVLLLGFALKAVTVPKGAEIPLVFDQALNSKTAKAGDMVYMHVADNVNVNGQTVVRKGEKVKCVVSSVEKRKHFGVNAKLRLAFNPVLSAWGQTIDIEPKDKGKYSGSRTDKAAMAAGGGALILGPVGLAGGYFVVGKQVEIKVGDRIISEVSHDTTVGAI
jgi:hypothetical protein